MWSEWKQRRNVYFNVKVILFAIDEIAKLYVEWRNSGRKLLDYIILEDVCNIGF